MHKGAAMSSGGAHRAVRDSAADSHTLYGALYHYPRAKHEPGEMRKIVDWDGGWYLGEIPEPNVTYNVIGNSNEHGLVIAETTFGG
jgi:hypothetical protein